MTRDDKPQPIGWQGSGPDFEVYGTGPYEWVAYDEDMTIGTGRARTRIGLMIAMARFRKWWRRQEQTNA